MQTQDSAEIAEQAAAMAPRLYPTVPPNRYLCFYPMDKKRGEQKNWYAEPIADRGRMMRDHGMIGRRYAGNPDLHVNEDIFAREMETADRNRAISYLMRSFGMISHDVDENLAMYLRQCSVEVNARELALMAAMLANGGVNPATGETLQEFPTLTAAEVIAAETSSKTPALPIGRFS